jgi:hypothetical protein
VGRGSKPGERRGGRQKGTPNKRTQRLREATDKALQSGEAVSPQEFMLSLVNNRELDVPLRLEAARSVAPYVHPRLAQVDLTSRNANVHYVIGDTPPTAEEWLAETNANANIEGRSTPVGTTLQHITHIEIEMRDKRIEQLTAEIEKLKDALTLHEAREIERKYLY